MFGRRFDLEKVGQARAPFFSHRLFGKGVVGACDWSRSHTLRSMPDEDMMKFLVGEHPITAESRNKKMTPTPEWRTGEVERKRKLLEAAGSGIFKKVLAETEAKELLERIGKEVDEDYIHDFRNWIAGIGKTSDYVKAGVPLTAVGQAKPLSRHKSVIDFIDKLTGRVIDYYAEIANMKMRGPAVGRRGGPATLNDLWLYFKYVVRNDPINPDDFRFADEGNDPNVPRLVGNQDGIRDGVKAAPSLRNPALSVYPNNAAELRKRMASRTPDSQTTANEAADRKRGKIGDSGPIDVPDVPMGPPPTKAKSARDELEMSKDAEAAEMALIEAAEKRKAEEERLREEAEKKRAAEEEAKLRKAAEDEKARKAAEDEAKMRKAAEDAAAKSKDSEKRLRDTEAELRKKTAAEKSAREAAELNKAELEKREAEKRYLEKRMAVEKARADALEKAVKDGDATKKAELENARKKEQDYQNQIKAKSEAVAKSTERLAEAEEKLKKTDAERAELTKAYEQLRTEAIAEIEARDKRLAEQEAERKRLLEEKERLLAEKAEKEMLAREREMEAKRLAERVVEAMREKEVEQKLAAEEIAMRNKELEKYATYSKTLKAEADEVIGAERGAKEEAQARLVAAEEEKKRLKDLLAIAEQREREIMNAAHVQQTSLLEEQQERIKRMEAALQQRVAEAEAKRVAGAESIKMNLESLHRQLAEKEQAAGQHEQMRRLAEQRAAEAIAELNLARRQWAEIQPQFLAMKKYIEDQQAAAAAATAAQARHGAPPAAAAFNPLEGEGGTILLPDRAEHYQKQGKIGDRLNRMIGRELRQAERTGVFPEQAHPMVIEDLVKLIQKDSISKKRAILAASGVNPTNAEKVMQAILKTHPDLDMDNDTDQSTNAQAQATMDMITHTIMDHAKTRKPNWPDEAAQQVGQWIKQDRALKKMSEKQLQQILMAGYEQASALSGSGPVPDPAGYLTALKILKRQFQKDIVRQNIKGIRPANYDG